MKIINKKSIQFLSLLGFLFFGVFASAQVDTISTCSGTFTDPGGSGNYLPNTDTTWTYCPDGTDGNSIAFAFILAQIGLGAGDSLFHLLLERFGEFGNPPVE